MQFSKIALLLPLVLSSVIATPVKEEQLPNQLEVTDNGVEEAGNALAKRGFGCPIDYFCNRHCKSLKGGRTGGYCKYQVVCTCVFG
ncbi:MAG: hypothetical protein Q9205_007635 [Flavoplaca limonia]